MDDITIKIRIMKADDFEAVVEIDNKLFDTSRREYHEMKFDKLFHSNDYIPVSLVAELEDGTVVGFVMGELFMGEYGIFQEAAALDTIGVDPDYQHKGIGRQLLIEFMDHLKEVGVKRLNTLIDFKNTRMKKFFTVNEFIPSETINLERIL